MPKPQRKPAPAPATPQDWYSVVIRNLEVFNVAQNEVSGYEDVDAPYENEAGEFMFVDPDGKGSGYFADGSEPRGWNKNTRKQSQPVFRDTRGNISGIEFYEGDADGAKIDRRKEGYAEIEAFGKNEILEAASADADLAAKHEAVISALRDYAAAWYAYINA